MLKFIECKSSKNDILQFIVNLLYLGMKSGNGIWAESHGTAQAVRDLLLTVPDSFIDTANNILANGSIRISVIGKRLEEYLERDIDVEGYQDIVDILRDGEYISDFSENCRQHFEKLTKTFSVHEDLFVR